MFLIGVILAGFLWWEADRVGVDPRIRENARRIAKNARRIAEHDSRLTELERQVAELKERDNAV